MDFKDSGRDTDQDICKIVPLDYDNVQNRRVTIKIQFILTSFDFIISEYLNDKLKVA